MSDSVRPHGEQPTRLLCPRDSPGKNTRVGCHFLLHGGKAGIIQVATDQGQRHQYEHTFLSIYYIYLHKSESEVTQLHLTLCDPMDCSLPGSTVHGIFQARVLEWVAIFFSRDTYICIHKYNAIRGQYRHIYSIIFHLSRPRSRDIQATMNIFSTDFGFLTPFSLFERTSIFWSVFQSWDRKHASQAWTHNIGQ